MIKALVRPFATVALAGTLGVSSGCAPQISTQQEVALGQQTAAELAQELPLVRDRQVVNYVNDLGRAMARRADPRGIQYTFYVVNANEVNAFAIPGGHVYVNRGLIERSANVTELAGVLAHEIGHVVHRHGIEQWERAQTANTAIGVLYGVLLGRSPSQVEQAGIQIGGSAVLAGYSRDAEREADDTAINYMIASGYHPAGLVTMFETLLAESRSNPSGVAQWFSTHPTTQERINDTRAAINAIPASSLQNLTTNTNSFATFKSRVRSLPAAP